MDSRIQELILNFLLNSGFDLVVSPPIRYDLNIADSLIDLLTDLGLDGLDIQCPITRWTIRYITGKLGFYILDLKGLPLIHSFTKSGSVFAMKQAIKYVDK